MGNYFEDRNHTREIRVLEQEIAKLEAEFKEAVDVIEDFKNNGTRHDLNPTGKFMSCGCFNSFSGDHWQSYIRSQDRYVREKAEQFLAKYRGEK